MATHIFTRGETVAVALANPSSVPVSAVTSKIKPTTSGTAPTGDVVAEFIVTEVEEIPGDNRPGWILTLTPTMSLALAPGNYLFDARLELENGGVEITDMETLVIKAGTTETA